MACSSSAGRCQLFVQDARHGVGKKQLDVVGLSRTCASEGLRKDVMPGEGQTKRNACWDVDAEQGRVPGCLHVKARDHDLGGFGSEP